MIFEEKNFELNSRRITLRSAKLQEADMLINYLKTVSGETRFLMCEPDEINITTEEEIAYIKEHNESDNSMLILAFVDGEYAGNCSFDGKTKTRREKHRAEIGIALFLRFAGFGLGRLMLEQMLEKMKEAGFEQAELTVAGGNDRAYHLYESLGFCECGRIPNASKFDDGTYGENILMIMPLE